GTAWKYHDPGTPGPEGVRGQLLVVAQVPTVLSQAYRMRLTVDVAGEIFGRPTDLEQHLLDPAALTRVDDDRVVVDARAQHRRNLLVAQHLLEHRAVKADQRQAVHGAFDEVLRHKKIAPMLGARID